MYKTFPQEETKSLIIKLQKLMKNKNKMNQKKYKRKYNQIMDRLYPILEFVQYTQINKKVVHLNSRMRTTYSKLQEGYGDYQEDLVLQQIEQMINYIPKIDTNKKISNILYVIQVQSTRIYFYSTIITPKLKFTPLDIDNESNQYLIDDIDENEEIEEEDEEEKYERYEKQFKKISSKIYLDYIKREITYSKFLSYTFLIHMLYFFIEEEKKSDHFISLYNKRIYNKTNKKSKIYKTTKLIYEIYKIYKNKNINNYNYNLKIGLKTIESFIKRYFMEK